MPITMRHKNQSAVTIYSGFMWLGITVITPGEGGMVVHNIPVMVGMAIRAHLSMGISICPICRKLNAQKELDGLNRRNSYVTATTNRKENL